VDSIIAAISFLENNPGVQLDALVIARGGGSEQSLAVFNDYRLCRAVCMCSLPVIAAIGHEKDMSAIEQCAWLTPAPSTPSGIGKYLQNRYQELQEQLAASITRLIHHFNNVHHGETAKIRAFLKNIPARAAAYLKWREERFFSLARHLDQSVAFTVRGQEKRIGALTLLIVKKYRFLLLKGGQAVQALAASIMDRVRILNRRDAKGLAKTMARLDFEKLRRDNRNRRQETRKKARLLYTQAVKKNTGAQKDLNAALRLVQASDPRQILKKGFTLALDEENHVITSLEQFKKKKKAALRFHDGTADIREDENKEV
jgi:exodeoxyribonuclease VII large subunit